MQFDVDFDYNSHILLGCNLEFEKCFISCDDPSCTSHKSSGLKVSN